MNYEQLTCLPELEVDCSPTSYLATNQCLPSSRKSHAVDPCAPGCSKNGSPGTCTSIAETCENSISPHGPAAWIASQRDSLARIFHALDLARASKAHGPALSGKCFEQLTLFGQDLCSSKTRQRSGPKVDTTLSGLSWRGDIPGATERLPLLLSERVTSGTAGGCSLPTLTACGNWNRRGSSANSGDGLATALRKLPTLTSSDGTGGPGVSSRRTGGMNLRTALKRLPTLCASDYKSPYSEAGYQKQRLQRYKPLRDTLAHIIGHRLTPEFAEWWMGWPLRWTVAPKQRG